MLSLLKQGIFTAFSHHQQQLGFDLESNPVHECVFTHFLSANATVRSVNHIFFRSQHLLRRARRNTYFEGAMHEECVCFVTFIGL